ncbi:phosphatase PAP2 family protein [Oceanobacillus luteolus]|uniref:Phosphatase PAP2 family protein n=1 Tax=Oceanobacillus luteolus TaxID=1274358 RepID=A0ABW4HSI4_9BACI
MKQQKRILISLSIIVFVVMGIWIFQLLQGNLPYVDKGTIPLVPWLVNSYFYEPFSLITNLGSSFFLYPFVVVVTILLFIWFRHWLPALFFGGGTYLTHKVNVFIKHLVERERPSISVSLNAEGYSFPSGHAMVSIFCYGLLAYFITKKLKSKRAILTVQISFTILIFLIGISRYIINVHYLTDVLAGFFFGFLLLIGSIYLYEFIIKKRYPSKG